MHTRSYIIYMGNEMISRTTLEKNERGMILNEERGMREIKFNAFHKKQKRMFPVLSFDEYEIIEADSDIIEIGENAIGRCRINSYNAGECILVQYTGLKDKAGKEIYEGDILGMLHARVSNKVYWKVGWTDSRFDLPVGFIWGAFGMRSNIPQYIHPSVNDLEIIGNIHENPELLEKK